MKIWRLWDSESKKAAILLGNEDGSIDTKMSRIYKADKKVAPLPKK